MDNVLVLLATGLQEIEGKIETNPKLFVDAGYNTHHCYHRAALLSVVDELNPDVIVLSPHLNGEDDIVSLVITIRKNGTRVVFLPGNANIPDAKDLLRKLIPWGVYCYVFDPVTPEKILYRLQNPGKIKELPVGISQETSAPEIKPEIPVGKKTWFPRLNFKPPRTAALTIVNDTQGISKGYIIDITGIYSTHLSDDIWKSDWRLGQRAVPCKNNKLSVYSFSQELGSEITQRDQDVLFDLIEYLMTKGPVYVIDADCRFRSELIHLGAVE